MTDCDFAPIPRATIPWRRPHKLDGAITRHHVRVAPTANARWSAYTYAKPGHEYPTNGVGRCPQTALESLVEHPPRGPWPDTCATCSGPHAIIGDSPPGTDRLHWYCHQHEPHAPKPR